jgi:hypothetical protein
MKLDAEKSALLSTWMIMEFYFERGSHNQLITKVSNLTRIKLLEFHGHLLSFSMGVTTIKGMTG